MRVPAGLPRWTGRLVLVLAGAILWSAAAGCGPKPPAPVPVKGTVYYHDHAGGVSGLQFWPQEIPGVRVLEVACDKKGAFSFPCPPGRYKVTVDRPLLFDGQPDYNFPAAYTTADRTPLEVTIPEDGTESLPIRIPD